MRDVAGRDTLPRFSRGERLVHRSTTGLVGLLVATGAALYVTPIALAVGRRPLVEGLHVAAGLLLPVPVALGLLDPGFRGDLRRLNRFGRVDGQWLRRRDRRRAGLAVGKFNAGQKLAAATVAGLLLVLLGTGVVLLLPVGVDVPDRVRQGATYVHDVTTFLLLVLLTGHVWQALRHPEARVAMRTGAVDGAYARREHPAWAVTAAPLPPD